MRVSVRPALAGLALLALLPLTACDETGGISVTTPEQAVQDAVIARESGDLAAAEGILRSALDDAPANVAVRSELAGTLMQRDGLDLLDIDRIAQFITSSAGTATGTPPATASATGSTCAYADDPTATPFDPTTVAGFPNILTSRATINEVLALLEPVIPAELESFDICLSIVDGQLVYDHAAAAAALRASGMSDQRAGSVLAVHALARFLKAYLFVTTEVSQQTTWYRLGSGRIGVCVENEDTLREEAEGAVEDLGMSLLSLDLRARSFVGGANARSLVDSALDAFSEISDAVADFCSTGSL